MITKFFGQFLLEKGIIDRDQLLSALDKQRSQSPLLGELAVEMGLLTDAQAKAINTAQMREDKRFGDIAIERELLTAEQVDSLLENQRKNRPYIGQVLAELGYLTGDEVEKYLREHQQDRQSSEDIINHNIEECFDAPLVRRAVEVFPKIYQRVCKQAIALDSIESTSEGLEVNGSSWSQDIKLDSEGTKVLRITLCADSEHAIKIGSAFMNMPLSALDELAIDAVNEFVNTFTGHIYHVLSGGIEASAISPPQYSKSSESFKEVASLKFDGGEHSCKLLLQRS